MTDRRGLSIRCLPELIAALDEADNPPVTDEEVWEWIKKWREVERSLYTDENEGNRGAAYITPYEIKSIIRTWKYRHGDGRNCTRYRQGVCRILRYAPRKESVQYVLGIGMASVRRWDMTRYKSVDITERDDAFLLHFRTDREGQRAFGRRGSGIYGIRNIGFKPLWWHGEWYKIEHLKGDDFVIPKEPLEGDGYVAGEAS